MQKFCAYGYKLFYILYKRTAIKDYMTNDRYNFFYNKTDPLKSTYFLMTKTNLKHLLKMQINYSYI